MSAPTIDRADETPIKLDVFYGHVAIESRFRREGLRFIGEGRSLHYDGNGRLTKDTGWIPTGCEMTAPDERIAEQVSALVGGAVIEGSEPCK